MPLTRVSRPALGSYMLSGMKRRSKQQRQEDALRRARELARSGKCRDYLDIERSLTSEGYPEARDWLDRQSLRDDLKTLCDQARKEQGNAPRS